MGAGPSVASLESETKQNRDVLNAILQFMISETDLIDMYALASPTECRRYTIFTAASLNKFFKMKQLYPGKGPDGKYYFQRLDILQDLPGKLLDEKQTTCMELSRFFVRILHIFASISLTIMNMDMPPSTASLTRAVNKSQRTPLYNERTLTSVPFTRNSRYRRNYYEEPAAESNANSEEEDPLVGGALSPITSQGRKMPYILNENYKILNRYLDVQPNSETFVFSGTNFIIPMSTLIDTTNLSAVKDDAQPIIQFETKYPNSGKKVTVIAELTIVKVDDLEYRVSVEIKRPTDKIYTTPELSFKSYAKGLDPKYNNQTIPQYIKILFERLIGKKNSILGQSMLTRRKKRTITNLPSNNTAGVPPFFRVRGVLTALKSSTPLLAPAIALAARLLDPDSLNGSSQSTPAQTYICYNKFKFIDSGSLPTPGKSIATSYGIQALDKLFYNKFNKGRSSVSNYTKSKYSEFLKDMDALYGEKNQRAAETPSIDKITNVSNKDLCGTTSGILYTEDRDVIQILRNKANELIKRQLLHSFKGNTILKRLFIISNTTPILLQPSVEEGGIEAVENIAQEARQLLIEYYTDIESIYREAIELIRSRKDVFKLSEESVKNKNDKKVALSGPNGTVVRPVTV